LWPWRRRQLTRRQRLERTARRLVAAAGKALRRSRMLAAASAVFLFLALRRQARLLWRAAADAGRSAGRELGGAARETLWALWTAEPAPLDEEDPAAGP
jgi:hypothetical protein